MMAMRTMRRRVDEGSTVLRGRGENILERLRRAYEQSDGEVKPSIPAAILPYRGVEGLSGSSPEAERFGIFGMLKKPIPYDEFKKTLAVGRR